MIAGNRAWLRAAAIMGFGLLPSGCSQSAPSEAQNLLFVTLDTVRADHTAVLGYGRPTTPHLAALAADGVSFRHAYTMSSTTGPSHATLFTGRYAPKHGVVKNGVPLSEAADTLAERLGRHGYRTAGFASSFVLSSRFGLHQGFTHWDEDFDTQDPSLPMKLWEGHEVPGGGFDRDGAETTARAVDWLRRNGGRDPFFMFVHYFDAHEPYTPDPAQVARLVGGNADVDDIDLYDAEVAQSDEQLGALLDALAELGLAERTVVVVTSDHGQGLDDHDDPFHGINVYDESVRAVLVFRGPGILGGRVSDAPVEQVDLLPTLLELLLPQETKLSLPGRSLAGYMRGHEELDPGRAVFFYRQWYPQRRQVRKAIVRGEQFGVRVGNWKYIEGNKDGRRELYDLERDPGELENRFKAEPDRARELAEQLAAWRSANPRPGGNARELTDDERARLRALGYAE